jgi:peptidoglycan/xylan/chitin deacetylase (PgdA/CDA1 family)
MNYRHQLGKLFPLLKKINELKESNNSCVTIINYHGIPDEFMQNFKTHIYWLVKNYNIIDPLTFQSYLGNGNQLIGNNILITFDDGFISSYHATRDFLDPDEIKAQFFLPSDFIGENNQDSWRIYVSNNVYKNQKRGSLAFDYQRPMINKEIESLINNGHSIGSHTVTHPDLSMITDDKKLEYELFKSKEVLENNFGISINSLAYPFGSIKHINEKALKKISNYYSFCYSNIRGNNISVTMPLAIRRQDITPDIPLPYLGFIIEGGLDWYWSNHRKQLDKMVLNVTDKDSD